MGTKKITELPEESNFENSWMLLSKGEQSKKASMNRVKTWIKQTIHQELENTIVPNLEVAVEGNVLKYKINNMPYEMLEQIGDSIKIGLVRYKRYSRKKQDTGHYDIGRKWTLVDDTTSEYVTKNIGDNVANLKQKIFWTNVKILPEQLNTDSYFTFQPFGLTAANITSRYTYFVENNKTNDMRLSSLAAASDKTNVAEVENMFRVTGKNDDVKFWRSVAGGKVRMFYSLNVGLVAYRDVKIDGVTKRILGNIVPFRACLCFRAASTGLRMDYYSVFKKCK